MYGHEITSTIFTAVLYFVINPANIIFDWIWMKGSQEYRYFRKKKYVLPFFHH